MTTTTTPTAESATCSKCKYWNAVESDQGECRVRAPQTIAFNIDEETRFETRFPATAASDWCGEFEAR